MLTTVQKTNTKPARRACGPASPAPGMWQAIPTSFSTALGLILVPSTLQGGESIMLASKSPPSWSMEFKKKLKKR